MKNVDPIVVESRKLKPKEGMRVEMVSMSDDPNPVAKGTKGTIIVIDNIGTIHVKWDDGRMLGMIPGVDKYKLIPKKKSIQEEESISSSVAQTSSKISNSVPKMPQLKNTKTNSQFKSGIRDVKAESKNQIKGGKADKMSVEDLAKKHKVSVKKINKELEIGVKIEKEHVGNDESKAKEIAMDHIYEFPDFYSNKKYGALASEKGLKKVNKMLDTY